MDTQDDSLRKGLSMSDKKQDTIEGIRYQQSEAVRAAVSSIITRNLSHNFGSHKLSSKFSTQLSKEEWAFWDKAYGQEFENLMSATENGQVTKEEVNRLFEEAKVRLNKLIEELNDDTKTPVSTPDIHSEQSPPAAAEYILRLIIEEKDREIVLGDLYETYERLREKKGKRRADFWLCYEVARSVWPLVCRLVVRISGRIVRTRRAE
jgi:hypothetical protein